MADTKENLRLECHFWGRVQGVGFRFTTQRIARRYEVSGFVRNLPDGRVHLVAEGNEAEVEAFLANVAEAMEEYIQSHDVSRSPARGEFTAFEIRH